MNGPPGPRPARRGFLGLLGAAALAGCSGRETGNADADGTLTAVPLPESTSTPRDPQVVGPDPRTVRELETPWYERTATTTLSPEGLTVAFHPRPTGVPGLVGGGRFRRPGTEAAPARLDLLVQNTGDEAVTLARDPVPGRLVTPEDEAHAFLLPAIPPDDVAGDREGDEAERDRQWFDGCWRGRPSGLRTGEVEVESGDAESLVYFLVSAAEGPCLPVGTYAFETPFGWTFTLGVWRTDAPGPVERSRFAGTDVPDLPVDGPTAWFHRADRTAEVYLRPSAERVPLSGGTATLHVALFNHSTDVLVGNPLEYELLKLHEEAWYHVVPFRLPNPEGYLPSGATLEKLFELRHGPPIDRDDAIPVGHLGGGRYAVRFGMGRPDVPRQHAALLHLDAPRLELYPSPELRASGRNSPEPLGWLDPDGGLFDAIVTATRTERPADRTVLAEQVMQEPVLRNTLSLFEEHTETVELHTRDRVAERLLRPHETLRVSFRGSTYELVRRDD
jgi:hypothetical protein